MMTHKRLHFAFLNLGHFYDHMFMLLFAAVAALALTSEWELSYAELVPYGLPGFVAFGAGALPAGWLADRWSREGMMVVFFVGIGAAAMVTSLATTPMELGLGVLAIGLFASIYHPVGIPLIIQDRDRTGLPIAINGVYGNLGVASAALIAGLVVDHGGWRAVFALPGLVSVATGLVYARMIWARGHGGTDSSGSSGPIESSGSTESPGPAGPPSSTGPSSPTESSGPSESLGLNEALETRALDRSILIRTVVIVLISTALGAIVFQSTTFALPKIFEERLGGIAISATSVGWYTFLAFSLAAVGQLVVGYFLDHHSLRAVFVVVAGSQALFLALMPGLRDGAALVVALAFMLAVFGQIPINDVLVGRVTRGEWRSRVFACRYVVSFACMAIALPMISWLHVNWGFDALFRVLAMAAFLILLAVSALPRAAPSAS